MLRKAALLAAFLGVLAGAPLAHASELVKRPAVTWIRGDGSFTKASRGKKQINTIVIHATDGGSLLGNVWWLSGGHSHASAHYVVARDGSIVQLVHLSDIAWHAGNWKMNSTRSASSTSARPTTRPASRRPSTHRPRSSSPGSCGATTSRSTASTSSATRRCRTRSTRRSSAARDHHTDPGPHWRWGFYLNLVRQFAFPERYALHVDSTTIDQRRDADRASCRGACATKGARAPRRLPRRRRGRLERLAQAVRVRRRPRLEHDRIANGTHVLRVRATGGGRTALAAPGRARRQPRLRAHHVGAAAVAEGQGHCCGSARTCAARRRPGSASTSTAT